MHRPLHPVLPLLASMLLGAGSLICAQAPESTTLPGADGREHTPLVVPPDKKGAVLFFVSPYCPTSNTFVPEMNRIVTDNAEKFAFYFVHADPEVKLTDVLQHTEMSETKATVLLDKEQKLAKLTQAKITPEVAVLAPDGKTTLYQGRINDLYLGPTKRQRQATTKDLRDALDAIQAGKPVANARTEAMGCKISGMKWPQHMVVRTPRRVERAADIVFFTCLSVMAIVWGLIVWAVVWCQVHMRTGGMWRARRHLRIALLPIGVNTRQMLLLPEGARLAVAVVPLPAWGSA